MLILEGKKVVSAGLSQQYSTLWLSISDVDTDPGRTAELARVAAYPQAPTRRLRADENDIFNGAY